MKTFSLFMLMLAGVSTAWSQKADSASVKLLSRITGTWGVQREIKNGKDVTDLNKSTLKTIKFTLDGHFIWKKDKAILDSGSFHTNEEQPEVYFESVKDRDHQREWKAELKKPDLLILTEKKGDKPGGTRYECKKVPGRP
jgi:hypothetical protein